MMVFGFWRLWFEPPNPAEGRGPEPLVARRVVWRGMGAIGSDFLGLVGAIKRAILRGSRLATERDGRAVGMTETTPI